VRDILSARLEGRRDVRYSRIHRLLRILTLIQSGGGWNAHRLAEACGATVRTIYRDLNMLEAAGIPYHFDDQGGGYRVRSDFFMPPVELTLEEALAIVCLADRIGRAEQIPFLQPAARAVAKIRGQLPAGIRDRLDEVEPHVEIRLAASISPHGATDVYQLIRQAIATRRALRCVYESPRRCPSRRPPKLAGADALAVADADALRGESAGREFLFRPYCLFFSQRAWYAIGHHSGHDSIRCLKLSRFARMEPTDRPYAIPDDFSLQTYLGKAWRMIPGKRLYRVELVFDPEFAETVADTHWHPTQEEEWIDDGSVVLRFEVAGLDEIVWWVLSMGPHCLVRRPRELANRVRALARATAALYGSASGRAKAAFRAGVSARSCAHPSAQSEDARFAAARRPR